MSSAISSVIQYWHQHNIPLPKGGHIQCTPGSTSENLRHFFALFPKKTAVEELVPLVARVIQWITPEDRKQISVSLLERFTRNWNSIFRRDEFTHTLEFCDGYRLVLSETNYEMLKRLLPSLTTSQPFKEQQLRSYSFPTLTSSQLYSVCKTAFNFHHPLFLPTDMKEEENITELLELSLKIGHPVVQLRCALRFTEGFDPTDQEHKEALLGLLSLELPAFVRPILEDLFRQYFHMTHDEDLAPFLPCVDTRSLNEKADYKSAREWLFFEASEGVWGLFLKWNQSYGSQLMKIHATQLDDSHLKTIREACPQLRALHLERLSITDLSTGSLKLEELTLIKCASLAHLRLGDPTHLRTLSLSDCPALDKEEVRKTVESLSQLRELDAPGFALADCVPSTLRSLSLKSFDEAIRLAPVYCPDLERLKITEYYYLGDSYLAILISKLPNLRILDISAISGLEQPRITSALERRPNLLILTGKTIEPVYTPHWTDY